MRRLDTLALLKKELHAAILTKSDINEHVSLLYQYGLECDRITEFGVRTGVSTRAFLASLPGTYTGYDLNPVPRELQGLAFDVGSSNYIFHKRSSVAGPIEDTDLLFIDSHHTYELCRQELFDHQGSVSKYIILHDVVTFGVTGEDGKCPGLQKAIGEFLWSYSQWKTKEWKTNNNGLCVLERV